MSDFNETLFNLKSIFTLAGITLSLRLMGPFLGYVLGAEFLKMFISTASVPLIDQNDQRWMGRWWLGFEFSKNINMNKLITF